MPSLPEYRFDEFVVPSATVPGRSPASEASLRKQVQTANDYRKNLPSLQAQQADQFKKEAAQNLALGLRGAKKDFNRRGMLHSGMRLGAEAGVRQNTRADLASKIMQNNLALNDQADLLDQAAISSGYNVALANPNLGEIAGGAGNSAANQLAQSMYQNQLWGNLAGAGANGLGYYLANRTPSTTTTTNPSLSSNRMER